MRGKERDTDTVSDVIESGELMLDAVAGPVLRPAYAAFDAQARFGLQPGAEPPTACRCGGVMAGRLSPRQCPLFGTACTPDDPAGPCMVSSEGACAAFYRYGI